LGGGSGRSKTTTIPAFGFHGERDEIGEPEDRADDEQRSHTGVPFEGGSRAPRHGPFSAFCKQTMKLISASIIVLAGAFLIIGSSRFTGDTQTFVEVVGCIVALVGLGGWCYGFKEK
jgi:hypothetical protein